MRRVQKVAAAAFIVIFATRFNPFFTFFKDFFYVANYGVSAFPFHLAQDFFVGKSFRDDVFFPAAKRNAAQVVVKFFDFDFHDFGGFHFNPHRISTR